MCIVVTSSLGVHEYLLSIWLPVEVFIFLCLLLFVFNVHFRAFSMLVVIIGNKSVLNTFTLVCGMTYHLVVNLMCKIMLTKSLSSQCSNAKFEMFLN